jgi:hypothetical protein
MAMLSVSTFGSTGSSVFRQSTAPVAPASFTTVAVQLPGPSWGAHPTTTSPAASVAIVDRMS